MKRWSGRLEVDESGVEGEQKHCEYSTFSGVPSTEMPRSAACVTRYAIR